MSDMPLPRRVSLQEEAWPAVEGAEPPRLPGDARVPHPARVYAYWLGSKDHYQADADAALAVLRHRPQAAAGARANRAFAPRVTACAVEQHGITQFLDIGTGLPAPGATHHVAQQLAPGCRVAYVDNDPVVLANARALLTPEAGLGVCHYIYADVRDPAGVLASAAAVLDFTRPVAVWLLAILHFLADDQGPAGIITALAAGLAPGSLVAVSHLTADKAPSQVARAVSAYNTLVPVSVHPRSRDQVTGLLGGLELLWPGVVPVTQWRPSIAEAPASACDLYGGLALVPHPAGPRDHPGGSGSGTAGG
jgi:hypothetical protein